MIHQVKQRWGIDDSLDVFAVHGVGGMLGSILLALFLSPMLGGVGYAGGMNLVRQIGAQLGGVAVVAIWSAAVTLLVAYGLKRLLPMRVSEDEEREGLDINSHGERAWEMD
jgi:Amt family ammonium transporter